MVRHSLQQPWLKRVSILALMAYAGMIGWLSLTPVPEGMPVSDKILHVGAYGLFMLLAAPIVLLAPIERLFLAGGAIFMYSGFLEICQAFVPGRYPEGLDLLANGAGIGLAMVGLFLLQRWLKPEQLPQVAES